MIETIWCCKWAIKGGHCDFETEDQRELTKHKLKEHGYHCQVKGCNYASLSPSRDFEVEDHMKTEHGMSLKLPCKLCHETLEGINEFDKHMTFTHGTNHWQLNLGMREAKRMGEKLFGVRP